MINKIDHARKGMCFGCMTEEEQQFLRDADKAGADIDIIKIDGTWRVIRRPNFDRNAAYWTNWVRPEEPKQPTNLPDGWKAYPVIWTEGGGTVGLESTETAVDRCHPGCVYNGRVLCGWLYNNKYAPSCIGIAPCDYTGFAKWAIFRPIEVTE
jgi:hypothetical protein